jgi:hypothetical protein
MCRARVRRWPASPRDQRPTDPLTGMAQAAFSLGGMWREAMAPVLPRLQGLFVGHAAQAVAHKLRYGPVHGAVAALQFGVGLHPLGELIEKLHETWRNELGGSKFLALGRGESERDGERRPGVTVHARCWRITPLGRATKTRMSHE